jgi:hypothetical protein
MRINEERQPNEKMLQTPHRCAAKSKQRKKYYVNAFSCERVRGPGRKRGDEQSGAELKRKFLIKSKTGGKSGRFLATPLSFINKAGGGVEPHHFLCTVYARSPSRALIKEGGFINRGM